MLILHVITTLDGGGAEAVLARLAAADRDDAHHVVALTGGRAAALERAGVPVHTLDMPRGLATPHGLVRLARLVRRLRPDIVQSWMYHADLVAGLVVRVLGGPPVVWGRRTGYRDPDAVSLRTRAVARVCAGVSAFVPARIVSCSETSARLHARRGYADELIRIVPNGYDTTAFAPDVSRGRAVREQWGVGAGTLLFGMVARWDRQKDHANLIAALRLLRDRLPGAWHCVLVGPEMSAANRALAGLVEAAGLGSRVSLAGPRQDVPAVMNALDVHVLSSRGEGFPNVIAEAMACGTPCIATDVGDARLIVGDTGWMVPPGDSTALADAMAAAAAETADPARFRARRQAARERIAREFSMERMIRGYRAVWQEASSR